MYTKKPRRRLANDVARIDLMPAGRELLKPIEGKHGRLRVERRVMHPVYKKFIMRSKKYAAHDEQNLVKGGETVRIEDYPGIGNVLFRIAAAKGYDEKHGLVCTLDTFAEMQHVSSTVRCLTRARCLV